MRGEDRCAEKMSFDRLNLVNGAALLCTSTSPYAGYDIAKPLISAIIGTGKTHTASHPYDSAHHALTLTCTLSDNFPHIMRTTEFLLLAREISV